MRLRSGSFARDESLWTRRGDGAATGSPETAARCLTLQALQAALVGNCKAAHAKAGAPIPSAYLLLIPVPRDLASGSALALCGDIAAAQRAAEETSKQYPLHTLWNAVELPTIRAAIELNRQQPAKAVELLRSATPYERPYASTVYLRGLPICVSARTGSSGRVPEDPRSQGRQLGAVLSALLCRAGPRRSAHQRHRPRPKGLPELPDPVERRRPDIPILKEASRSYARLN